MRRRSRRSSLPIARFEARAVPHPTRGASRATPGRRSAALRPGRAPAPATIPRGTGRPGTQRRAIPREGPPARASSRAYRRITKRTLSRWPWMST
jgi:hypothetical protein